MTDDVADDVQQMLLDSAAAFLRDTHSLHRVRRLRAASASFDPAMWRQLAENGWLGICLPEPLGGAGLSVAAAAELAALFGAALMPEPFALSAVAPSAILAASSESPLTSTLAQALSDGSRLLTFAWQDRFGQLDPEWGGVTLTAEGNGFRLRGRKVLVDATATDWLVTAVLDGMPMVLAVAAQAVPGHDAPARMTDGRAVVSIEFDGLWVDRAAVVVRGEPARAAAVQALDDARLVISAQLAGIAAEAIDRSVAYTAQRVQFGQPISAFQVIRHRLVDLDLQRRLSFASWRHAARLDATSGSEARARSSAISAAKARCSEAALTAARSAIQLHGAMGYTEEADIGLFMDAALGHASALGNASAHRWRFAQRGVLAEVLA